MLLLANTMAPTAPSQNTQPHEVAKIINPLPTGESSITLKWQRKRLAHLRRYTARGWPTPTAIELDGNKAVQLVGTLTAEEAGRGVRP